VAEKDGGELKDLGGCGTYLSSCGHASEGIISKRVCFFFFFFLVLGVVSGFSMLASSRVDCLLLYI
jgi:hypothetical protein